MAEENNENVRGYQFDDVTFRSYPAAPATWSDEDRGFDAIMASENPVLVLDMKSHRVVREVLRMDGLVMPAGNRLPLQDNHQRGSVRNTLGSTRNIRIEKGQLIGRNVISSVESAVATKVKEGHLTDNSIGYLVLDREIIEPGTEREVSGVVYRADQMPLQVSTKWMPKENSLTPIGADEAAKFRSSVWFADKERKEMAEEKKPETSAAAEPEKKVAETVNTTTETETAEVAAPETKREDLLAEITPRGYEALLEKAVIEGLDLDAYRALLLAEHAKKRAPVGTPEPKVDEKKDGLEKISDAEFRRMF